MASNQNEIAERDIKQANFLYYNSPIDQNLSTILKQSENQRLFYKTLDDLLYSTQQMVKNNKRVDFIIRDLSINSSYKPEEKISSSSIINNAIICDTKVVDRIKQRIIDTIVSTSEDFEKAWHENLPNIVKDFVHDVSFRHGDYVDNTFPKPTICNPQCVSTRNFLSKITRFFDALISAKREKTKDSYSHVTLAEDKIEEEIFEKSTSIIYTEEKPSIVIMEAVQSATIIIQRKTFVDSQVSVSSIHFVQELQYPLTSLDVTGELRETARIQVSSLIIEPGRDEIAYKVSSINLKPEKRDFQDAAVITGLAAITVKRETVEEEERRKDSTIFFRSLLDTVTFAVFQHIAIISTKDAKVVKDKKDEEKKDVQVVKVPKVVKVDKKRKEEKNVKFVINDEKEENEKYIKVAKDDIKEEEEKYIEAAKVDIKEEEEEYIEAAKNDIKEEEEERIEAAKDDIKEEKKKYIKVAKDDIKKEKEKYIEVAKDDIKEEKKKYIKVAKDDIKEEEEKYIDVAKDDIKEEKKKYIKIAKDDIKEEKEKYIEVAKDDIKEEKKKYIKVAKDDIKEDEEKYIKVGKDDIYIILKEEEKEYIEVAKDYIKEMEKKYIEVAKDDIKEKEKKYIEVAKDDIYTILKEEEKEYIEIAKDYIKEKEKKYIKVAKDDIKKEKEKYIKVAKDDIKEEKKKYIKVAKDDIKKEKEKEKYIKVAKDDIKKEKEKYIEVAKDDIKEEKKKYIKVAKDDIKEEEEKYIEVAKNDIKKEKNAYVVFDDTTNETIETTVDDSIIDTIRKRKKYNNKIVSLQYKKPKYRSIHSLDLNHVSETLIKHDYFITKKEKMPLYKKIHLSVSTCTFFSCTSFEPIRKFCCEILATKICLEDRSSLLRILQPISCLIPSNIYLRKYCDTRMIPFDPQIAPTQETTLSNILHSSPQNSRTIGYHVSGRALTNNKNAFLTHSNINCCRKRRAIHENSSYAPYDTRCKYGVKYCCPHLNNIGNIQTGYYHCNNNYSIRNTRHCERNQLHYWSRENLYFIHPWTSRHSLRYY